MGQPQQVGAEDAPDSLSQNWTAEYLYAVTEPCSYGGFREFFTHHL
jgi:hypothetical protein